MQYACTLSSELITNDCLFLDAVPLSIYAFTLPLPYIGVASTLPPGFVAGAAVLIAGLLMHGLPQPENCGESQE
uniref:Uncharacterized protein n=1 Tax=Aegilops tauschii subsp. strangulata TaxID=200361 RepID=A0A453GPS9_AEGTS